MPSIAYEVYDGPEFCSGTMDRVKAEEYARYLNRRSLAVISIREYVNGRFTQVILRLEYAYNG